jgi:hypothetical protein
LRKPRDWTEGIRVTFENAASRRRRRRRRRLEIPPKKETN